jgi:hypothetical protein
MVTAMSDGVEVIGDPMFPRADERIEACLKFCAGIQTEKLAGKSLAEYVAEEAYLSGITVNEGGADIGLSGMACQMLASAFAGQFVGSGAVNYLEVNMVHQEIGPFTVTIQRQQGKTPATLQREAEAQRDALLAAIQDVVSGSTIPETSVRDNDGMDSELHEEVKNFHIPKALLAHWRKRLFDALVKVESGHG